MAEEKRLAREFDLTTCTTKAELKTLDEYRAAAETNWFPNGVDAEYFHTVQSYDPNIISFIGRMDYFPNQEAMLSFCELTWPLIKSARPAAQLLIVGSSPSRKIVELGELDGVTVTGFVEDVRPYVQKSALMVAPLRIARGTQNKILEAMAMGIPVICSTIAAGGVDAIVGEHLLTADSSQEYAEQALELMADPTRRAALSRQARARVESHHAWPASMTKMQSLIESTVTGNRKGYEKEALIHEN